MEERFEVAGEDGRGVLIAAEQVEPAIVVVSR